MSNSDDTSRREARPRRSRFNFSYQPPEPTPSPTYKAPLRNSEREARREARQHNRQAYTVTDKNGDLVFNVAQMMRQHEGATRDYDVSTVKLILDEENGLTATNIKGHIHFTQVGHDILSQGKFEADSLINCVRCLNDFTYHLEFEIEDIYRPSIDVYTGLPFKAEEGIDDDKLLIDENHLLDLGEAIRQQILVSLPINPNCGEDCPGLYSELERINSDVVEPEEEDISPAEPDKRWAILKNLNLEE